MNILLIYFLHPKLISYLNQLAGKIDDQTLVAMNANLKLNGQSESQVAAAFLKNSPNINRYHYNSLVTRSILAGIKTSTVINVGTATLGALIGAGGYGQPILTGIRLDNTSLILQGAIPAAVLALIV